LVDLVTRPERRAEKGIKIHLAVLADARGSGGRGVVLGGSGRGC
jgi:hypothetical protein